MKINHVRKFFDKWRKTEDRVLTREIAFYCAQRSGIYSDLLVKLVVENDIAALCAFKIDYSDPLNSVRDLQYARQCLALYSKDADIEIVDTERMMYYTFLEAEMKNRLTNLRWSTLYNSGKLFTCEDSFVDDVSRKISYILGDCPDLLDCDFGFGPGSSANVRKKTSARYKLNAPPSCSSEMVTTIKRLCHIDMPYYWEIHNFSFIVIPGVLSGVPKNALTKRSVLIEPLLNTPYQKSIGTEMKKRLLRFGCNLYDQTKNQELALLGSITDEIVTVDIRNASNTMALLVVYHSLVYCPQWSSILERLRTGTAEYKGKLRTLEMFSSMGNGFTFELESLLFYAIACVVTERKGADLTLVSVYGDDIIVPSECYENLIEALAFYGFEINTSKSYHTGPFRESCGSDYYLGENIRPFFKKDRWTDARLVGFLNHDFRAYRLIPESMRNRLRTYLSDDISVGPDGYGDGHLLVDDLSFKDLTVAKREKRNNIVSKLRQKKSKSGCCIPCQQDDLDGWWVSTITKIPNRDLETLDLGDRLYPFYNIYKKPPLISDEFEWNFPSLTNGPELTYTRERLSVPEVICHGESSSIDKVSLEDDPYVLRGGWRANKTRIYMFKGSLDFVENEIDLNRLTEDQQLAITIS